MVERSKPDDKSENSKENILQIVDDLLQRIAKENSDEATNLLQALERYRKLHSLPEETIQPSSSEELHTSSTEESEEKKEQSVEDRAKIMADIIKSQGVACLWGKFPHTGVRLEDGSYLSEPHPNHPNHFPWTVVGEIGSDSDQHLFSYLSPNFNQHDLEAIPPDSELFVTVTMKPEQWNQYLKNIEERYNVTCERGTQLRDKSIRYIYYFFRSEIDYAGRRDIEKVFQFIVPQEEYDLTHQTHDISAPDLMGHDMSQQLMRKILESVYPGFQKQIPFKAARSLILNTTPHKYSLNPRDRDDLDAWRKVFSEAFKWNYV